MPLEFELRLPERAEEGAPLIVLLHGRGGDRHDLQGLRSGLPRGAVIVTPQAPFSGTPWGYGPGWAWYRYLGEDRPEPETFDASQARLEEFLGGLRELVPVETGPLVLGGFSQGGTMSLAYALRRPGEIAHAINFSGFLANHSGVPVTPETVAGTRIFWGHGIDDPNIPLEMAETGRSALRAAGADLDARDYPIGHWIDPRELADAAAWIEEGVRRAAPDGAG